MKVIYTASFLLGMGLCWLFILFIPFWLGWLLAVLTLFTADIVGAAYYKREISRDRVFWFFMGSLAPIYYNLVLMK